MKKKIWIQGMSCMHCINHVKEALSEICITNVEVDLNSKTACIETDKDINDKDIKVAIEDFGYGVTKIEEI